MKAISACTFSESLKVVGQQLYSTYHLFEEADHYIRVYKCCVVSDEGLSDVGHDAGVVAGKALSSIHLHKETSPVSLGGKTLWYQQVPDDTHIYLYILHIYFIYISKN